MVVAVISRIAPTPVPIRIPPKVVPSRYLLPSHLHNHSLQRSIEILKFPLWLHAYLSKRPRFYCVWSNYKASTKPSKSGEQHETKMLRDILQHYPGQDVGLKKDVNLVFVHVSAVKSLHKLPAYVERVWKRVDVMFVMYGTHYNVPSSSWSMKRIYRSGGIVTFSPEGFLEDPLGVYNTCCDIARHQFWAVRVIPSVLGMLVRKYYGDNDSALLALDNDDFVYDFVVNAIDEGKFSFGRMPTVGPSWTRTKSEDWLAEQAIVLSGGPRSILEHALREFDAKYANIPHSDYIRVVHDSIAEEVRLSQLHPTIMEEYRRYVVLGTEKETKTYTSDSFEYRTPPSFEFNYKSSKSHPQPS
ncbi:hypothetical protein BDZ89DRAFT_463357 [Hymenopellis radicata]|nr:hypothetical protein BDZ89DRAFT_463357 [Hymenopellis radicata]